MSLIKTITPLQKKEKPTKQQNTHTEKPTAEIFFPYSSCFIDRQITSNRGIEKPKTKVSSVKQPKIYNVIHH